MVIKSLQRLFLSCFSGGSLRREVARTTTGTGGGSEVVFKLERPSVLRIGPNGARLFFDTGKRQMGRDHNPWSDGLNAHYEEITAVAMLLGEEHPILCSCCIGTGKSTNVFGGPSACGQCQNTGYDWIGKKTHQHFVGRHNERR